MLLQSWELMDFFFIRPVNTLNNVNNNMFACCVIVYLIFKHLQFVVHFGSKDPHLHTVPPSVVVH